MFPLKGRMTNKGLAKIKRKNIKEMLDWNSESLKTSSVSNKELSVVQTFSHKTILSLLFASISLSLSPFIKPYK